LTIFQKCKADNQAAAEERAATMKRRQQHEEMRANRTRPETDGELTQVDHSALDNLLEKLRNGDSAGRKSRRNRGHKATPSKMVLEPPLPGNEVVDETTDKAKELLARLKAGVLDAPASSSNPSGRPRQSGSRRTRLRMGDLSVGTSPLEEESEYETEGLPDTQPSSAEWDYSSMTRSHSRSSSTSDALNEYMRARRMGSESALSSPQLATQPEETEPLE
jgi:cytokinesis protein